MYSTRKLILRDQNVNITYFTSDDIVLSDGENSYFKPRMMRELLKILMRVIFFSQKKWNVGLFLCP